jgi:hypothetical protein
VHLRPRRAAQAEHRRSPDREAKAATDETSREPADAAAQVAAVEQEFAQLLASHVSPALSSKASLPSVRAASELLTRLIISLDAIEIAVEDESGRSARRDLIAKINRSLEPLDALAERLAADHEAQQAQLADETAEGCLSPTASPASCACCGPGV